MHGKKGSKVSKRAVKTLQDDLRGSFGMVDRENLNRGSKEHIDRCVQDAAYNKARQSGVSRDVLDCFFGR